MSDLATGTAPLGTEATGLPTRRTLRRLFRRTEFGLIVAIVVVIVLTALQFRFVERKVQY